MSSDSYQSPFRSPPSSMSSSGRGDSSGRSRGRGGSGGAPRGPGHFSNRGFRGSSRGFHVPRSPSHARFNIPPDRDYMEGLIVPPIQTMTIPSLDPAEPEDDIKITKATYIGSYNWQLENSGRNTPTILVPGMIYFCKHTSV